MPRTPIYSRNQITRKTLRLIKEKGPSEMTARDVGAYLGTSSRPIFTAYENMDDLRNEVFKSGIRDFTNFMGEALLYTPVYLAYGLKLIRYCEKEPNLFAFLMEHISKNLHNNYTDPVTTKCKEMVAKEYKLSDEDLSILFQHTFILATGISTQIRFAHTEFSDQQIYEILTREFNGMMHCFGKKSKISVAEPTLNK